MTPQREALIAFWFWAFISGALVGCLAKAPAHGALGYVVLLMALTVMAVVITVSWWRMYVTESYRFPH